MVPSNRSSATDQRVLLIAIGNPLRRDDGVAQRVLDLLPPRPGLFSKEVLQLTPELAPELSGFDLVVFIDADVGADAVKIEACGENRSPPVLTHGTGPPSLVALARQLFAFQGQAFLCRIPAEDFSPGAGLSGRAEDTAANAAGRLEELVPAAEFLQLPT
jgi:hydrogenase maturation protease